MPSLTSPVTSASSCESRLVGTSHESPVKGPNSFRFTHFRKNASASPLESHSFKTKDLKCPVFTHFQKKGGGSPLESLQFRFLNAESRLSASTDDAQLSEQVGTVAKGFLHRLLPAP